MTRWIDAGPLADLPPEHPLGRELEGVSVVLLRRDERVVAVLDRCPHLNFPLRHGRMVDGKLECALHGWRFSVFEPDPDAVPPEARCSRFATRVVDGRIELDLDSNDSSTATP